ncbi:SMI1/KNR4 family protein [archaeon]|nr:MAG: SMI1/KNR4 family protein [archaeon]
MSSEKRVLFDRMALGVISYLETFSEIRTVSFQGNEPAQGSEVITWERKNNPYKLPADIKAFYSMFNGFNLSWSVEIGEKTEIIGEMKINKLDNVVKNSTEFFVQEYLPEDVAPPNPKLCAMFVIDSSCSLGEVVLLYRNSHAGSGSGSLGLQLSPGSSSNTNSTPEEPEVWLLDRSAQLTYLCKSFTNYMRLMVTHLGIYGWHSVFLDVGWSLTAQHWMQMFCKERLIVDRHYRHEVTLDKKTPYSG